MKTRIAAVIGLVVLGVTATGQTVSWLKLTSLVQPTGMQVRDAIVISPTEVYATLREGGVRRTTDAGATWTDITFNLATLDAGKLLRTPSGALLVSAAGTTGGIFRFAGTTWVKGTNSPTGQSIIRQLSASTVLAFGALYPDNATTIYRSTDDGVTWVKGHFFANAGLGQIMRISPAGDVWIGTETSGPLRSTDGVVTFVDRDIPGQTVNGAEMCFAQDGSVLYGGRAIVYQWTPATNVFRSLSPAPGMAAPGLPDSRQLYSCVLTPSGLILAGTGQAVVTNNSYVYQSP